jgi:hypothetical protein
MELRFGEVSDIPETQSSRIDSSLLVEFDMYDRDGSHSPEKALEVFRRAKRASQDDTERITDDNLFGLEKSHVPKAGRRATSLSNQSTSDKHLTTSIRQEKENVVFISYQWDSQRLVMKLRDRLSEKGFGCWMDVDQIGGGDQLYEEIDKGIRACRVFVSCVTERYTQSRNCRREVALANLYQKPIIPILMEKIEWPPPGSLALVFAELLYIEMTVDIDEKFDRLAEQVKKYVNSVGE